MIFPLRSLNLSWVFLIVVSNQSLRDKFKLFFLIWITLPSCSKFTVTLGTISRAMEFALMLCWKIFKISDPVFYSYSLPNNTVPSLTPLIILPMLSRASPMIYHLVFPNKSKRENRSSILIRWALNSSVVLLSNYS